MEPIIITLLLLVVLLLFITEKIPYDATGLLSVFSLVILSLPDVNALLSRIVGANINLHFLSPEEAIAGFANEAVVTIGAMFIISAALMRTGAVGFLGDKIIAFSKGRPHRVLILSMLTVAFTSAFVNNTPIVVLFVPIMLRVCFQYNLSPSKFLIPISYASILGGTCTLIGTSTNIIVSDIAAAFGTRQPHLHLRHIAMFELVPVGLPVAVVGLILIAFFARHVLPDRKTVTSTLVATDQKRFMTELEVGPGSASIGKTVWEAFLQRNPSLQILEVIRGEKVIYPPVDRILLEEGDILLTKGSANDILTVQREQTASIASELGLNGVRMTERSFTLAEVVIMPTSVFVGKTIEEVQFKRRYDVNVIAILRKGRHMHIQEKIRNIELAVGDTLLVQGGEDGIAKMRNAENVLLLEGISATVVNKNKAPIALAVIGVVVAGATLTTIPIMVLAVLGALVMVLTHCLPLKEAYKSLNGSVLVLIASTIALGTAMANTGTAEMYADMVLSVVQPYGTTAVLAAIFLLTGLLTNFISNGAAAALMTPVAIAAGIEMGFQPMPFVMAVLFGASACFATPIGYQTNLFIYGPGGYRFADYLKLGIPLILLLMAVAIMLIPQYWPLQPLTIR